MSVDRVEAIEPELFDRGFSAEACGLLDQPVGVGLVTRGSGAMDALRIPCPEPRSRPGNSVVGQAITGIGRYHSSHRRASSA